jgi:hypothetical protein
MGSDTLESKGDNQMAVPDPNNSQQWTPELWLQRFKEIVTAILGIAIVAFTLILAWQAFSVLRTGDTFDEKKMSAAKDILLLLLGLSGVVIGYYFGRVPADARAAQAQQQANEATGQAEQVTAQARSVADDIDRALDTASRGTNEVTARSGVSVQSTLNVDELRGLRDRLRNIATRVK